MYANCPKCKAASGGVDVCPACGLIFAKYLKARVAVPAQTDPEPEEEAGEISWKARTRAALLYVPEEVNASSVTLRAMLLAAAALYGGPLALMDIPEWEMSIRARCPPYSAAAASSIARRVTLDALTSSGTYNSAALVLAFHEISPASSSGSGSVCAGTATRAFRYFAKISPHAGQTSTPPDAALHLGQLAYITGR